MSRIQSDAQAVKAMVVRIESITERIVGHAKWLGYFEPPSELKTSAAPTPVITTLADALQAMDRAIDQCSGSLNVFD